MRTTIDIDDEQYCALKMRAAEDQTSVKALIAHAVGMLLRMEEGPRKSKRRVLPTIGSKKRKKLDLNHDRVNEILADVA